MVCKSCNKQIDDDVRFCPFCGAKVEDVVSQGELEAQSVQPQPQPVQPEAQQVQAEAQSVQPEPQPVQAEAQPVQPQPQQVSQNPAGASIFGFMKKYAKIIIPVAAIVFVAIVGLILFFALHKKTIDMREYSKITYDGCNKYGKAKIQFMTTDLAAELAGEEFKKDDSDNISLKSLTNFVSKYSDYAKYVTFISSIHCSFDKRENLSNGDVITVKLLYNQDLADQLKVKFKEDTLQFTVSGLKDANALDPFEKVSIQYEGTSPNARATVKYEGTDNILQSFNFSLDKVVGLKNGDKIKLTVNASDDQLLREHNTILTSKEKEYTVEGVDEYVADANEIPEDGLNTLKKETVDVLKAYFAKHKGDFKRGSLKYEGIYLLSRKGDGYFGYNNIAYVVYSTTVKIKGKKKNGKDYLPVKYTNIVKHSDGTTSIENLSNVNEYSIQGTNNSLKYGAWGFSSVSGYKNISTMKNDLVTTQMDSYEVTQAGLK